MVELIEVLLKSSLDPQHMAILVTTLVFAVFSGAGVSMLIRLIRQNTSIVNERSDDLGDIVGSALATNKEWRDIVDDLQRQITSMRERIDQQANQISLQAQEISSLRIRYDQALDERDEWRRKAEVNETEIQQLRMQLGKVRNRVKQLEQWLYERGMQPPPDAGL